MSLRKARRTTITHSAKTPPQISLEDLGVADSVRVSKLDGCAGLFWFQVAEQSAFVGVANNLKLQIDRILESLGPRVVPDWMDTRSGPVARLFVTPMPKSREDERENWRSVLLKQYGSRLNFFSNSLFTTAA
jgi:hypothetical protein